MKLTELHVNGFGVWHDLRLRDLSPEITVLYGPNEAGKTTLMHFLRGMLYGVTPERRERYLPPRNGGRPGGSLGLLTDEGSFDAERYVERGEDDLGRVLVTLPDGEQQGDRLLRDALESIDERTYCNVFAIGLDEINE
ncbi:MAG: AAA family ATPase, partial [Planctomycetota bacterium]